MAVKAKLGYDLDDATLQRMIGQIRQVGKEAGLSDKEIDKIANSVKDLDQKGGKHLQNVHQKFAGINGLVGNMTQTFIGFFAVQKLGQMASDIVNVTGKFQAFEAVLVNTLGSKSRAQKALGMLTNFVATTPHQMDEVIQSFIKLSNQGFIPTEKEMMKLSDLALSTNKTFDMLTEAVIDAQVGEFERLKEFGIRASKQGDQVTFAFKGVQTQVAFTNDSIRDYILSLGDLNGVAGSTAAIASTVTGQLSNWDDNTTSLAANIGNSQSGLISGVLTLANQALSDLNTSLKANNDLYKELEKRGISQLGFWAKAKFALGNYSGYIDDLNEKLIQLHEQNQLAAKVAGEAFEHIMTGGTTEWAIEAAATAEEKVAAISERLSRYSGSKFYEDIRELVLPVLDELNDEINGNAEAAKKAQAETDVLNKKYQEFLEKIKEVSATYKDIYKLGEEWSKEQQEMADIQKMIIEEGEKDLKEYYDSAEELDKDYLKDKEKRWSDHLDFMGEFGNSMLLLATTLGDSIGQINQEDRDEELARLKDKQDQELALAGDNEAQKQLIKEEYAARERQLEQESAEARRRLFLFEKAADLASVIIKTRLAVLQAIALSPLTFGEPFATNARIQGAISAAIIGVQALPAFADGVYNLQGPGTKRSDSILARLSKGESVVPADPSEKFGWALKPMIEDRNFSTKDLAMLALRQLDAGGGVQSARLDQDELAKAIAGPIIKAIEDKPELALNLDNRGIGLHAIKQGSRLQYLNRRFRIEL